MKRFLAAVLLALSVFSPGGAQAKVPDGVRELIDWVEGIPYGVMTQACKDEVFRRFCL